MRKRPRWNVMSGAHSVVWPPVKVVVHGAPLGQTTPALRQATRSVDVLMDRLAPVWVSTYVPFGARTSDGSWTRVSPVTRPGSGNVAGGVASGAGGEEPASA